MKNVLFVVNTEGQLLTASSLVFEQFNSKTGYQPYVLQLAKTGSARFLNPTNKPLLTCEFIELDWKQPGVKQILEPVLQTKFERVFIFLEQQYLNVYLAHYYKMAGSIICLAPDGNKPYYTVDRLAIGSRISQTLDTYRYLFSRGLYYFRPYFLSWNYGRLKPLDEIWVTFPHKFVNATKKKVTGFKVLPNQDVAEKVSAFFKFSEDALLRQTNGVVFYANNILYKETLYQLEIEALQFLKTKFPEVTIHLKYHPSTPTFQIEAFRKLGLNLFCNSTPAELYIARLTNSIVIGFWSTSLAVNNPSCKFYWLHNYVIKQGKMITDMVNLNNPTDHIKDIDDLNQISF